MLERKFKRKGRLATCLLSARLMSSRDCKIIKYSCRELVKLRWKSVRHMDVLWNLSIAVLAQKDYWSQRIKPYLSISRISEQ